MHNRALIDLHALPDLFPHRVTRAHDLLTLGLPSSAMNANTAPGGPWQRLLPGVLLLSNAPPTRPQLIQAALRYAGPGAVLTGHDALQFHGLRTAQPGGPIHVLVPHHRQLRGTDTVAIERTPRLPRPQLRNDFPVAPLERAILDTTRRMREVDTARAIIAESVQRGLTQPARLRAELDGGNLRGTAITRGILDELCDHVRSVAQGWARRLIHASHLPNPSWNVPLCNPNGQLLGVVDAWWDTLAVGWKIDSYRWHPSLSSYANAVTQLTQLTAAGITVLHTAPDRLRNEPGPVLLELQQTLTHAQTRSQPTIRAG
jgi:hypothetical protein